MTGEPGQKPSIFSEEFSNSATGTQASSVASSAPVADALPPPQEDGRKSTIVKALEAIRRAGLEGKPMPVSEWGKLYSAISDAGYESPKAGANWCLQALAVLPAGPEYNMLWNRFHDNVARMDTEQSLFALGKALLLNGNPVAARGNEAPVTPISKTEEAPRFARGEFPTEKEKPVDAAEFSGSVMSQVAAMMQRPRDPFALAAVSQIRTPVPNDWNSLNWSIGMGRLHQYSEQNLQGAVTGAVALLTNPALPESSYKNHLWNVTMHYISRLYDQNADNAYSNMKIARMALERLYESLEPNDPRRSGLQNMAAAHPLPAKDDLAPETNTETSHKEKFFVPDGALPVPALKKFTLSEPL